LTTYTRRSYRVFCLLLLCLIAGAFTQSLTDAQKVDQAIALVSSVTCETDTCRTRQKDVSTRLSTFKTYLPVSTPLPPPAPPVYATVTMLEALAARVLKLETGTAPAPVPTPTPTPTPEPTQPPVVLPPPSAEANAYADALCKQAGAACYRLQSQTEIDKYRFGRGLYLPKVDYDATANAAKWQWGTGDISAEQIRVPVSLTKPATGTSSVTIISDHRWDSAWMTEFRDASGNALGWKWLQVAVNGTARWFEPQMRWVGGLPPALGWYGAREYAGVRAPTTDGSASGGTPICGRNFGESVGPMLNCFQSKPNTWTRTWIRISMTAGDDYASVSWWMADETQEAMPIVLNANLKIVGPVSQFWFEYNTSAEQRVGGPMQAWARNVIVLRDVDSASTLQKPVK
jgi:hypothetical protein